MTTKLSAQTRVLVCDMAADCPNPVTHIEDKGFIYCYSCAQRRKAYGHRLRLLRPWELRELRAGRTLQSYEPGPRPKRAKAVANG